MKDRTVPPSIQDYGERIIQITSVLVIFTFAVIGVSSMMHDRECEHTHQEVTHER